MKTARVKFNLEDDFEAGDCVECPLYATEGLDCYGEDYRFCQLGYLQDECPIELEERRMNRGCDCQNWVSVEDRLPDGDVASVLIYTNRGGVSEGQYYPSIKSWKQFRWSVENADVTHWKPLPEPPKGE